MSDIDGDMRVDQDRPAPVASGAPAESPALELGKCGVRAHLGHAFGHKGGAEGQDDGAGTQEKSDEDPRLLPFWLLYENLPEADRAKVSWEEARERLLEDDAFYLNAAVKFKKCVLFGVDDKGRLLFADGLEYVSDMEEFTNLSYEEARSRVMFERNKKGEFLVQYGGEVLTGHELFPYDADDRKGLGDKGTEIMAFEKFTGRPFAKPHISGIERHLRESEAAVWVESGVNPDHPRYVDSFGKEGQRSVFHCYKEHRSPGIAVRRLLRV